MVFYCFKSVKFITVGFFEAFGRTEKQKTHLLSLIAFLKS